MKTSSPKTRIGYRKTARKKAFTEVDVLTAAYDRVRYIFNNFDKVVVSFSGGKDSTAVLNIALDVARELGKLPLEVNFIDEEVIAPPTHDYALRVKNNPDIALRWLCVPIKQRNACSFDEPFWWTWDAKKTDVWVRPLPRFAQTSVAGYDPQGDYETTGVGNVVNALYGASDGKVAVLTGVRTEESLRRFRALTNSNNDNYIKQHGEGKAKNVFNCHPIYDWLSTDVWLAIKQRDWDYNRCYDIFNLTHLNGKYLHQRVCVPFGEEAMRGFALYQECFPDMWAKMCKRVLGVGAAVRYANDALFGAKVKHPPQGLSWREYMTVVIGSYRREEYTEITKNINAFIAGHYRKSVLPIQDEDPDPISGASWKYFCKCALKGDFKARWLQNITTQCKKSSIKGDLSHIIQQYGTEEFKSAWHRNATHV